MVNGDVIVGEIKSLDRGVITFETDYSDSDFKIGWLNVKEIKSTQNYIMTFSNGDRKNGQIQTSHEDPSKVIVTDLDGTNSLHDIKDLVYMKGVKGDFLSKLSGSIDLGFTLTKARNNKQLTARSNVAYLTNQWGANATLDAVRSTQDSTEDINRTEGSVSARLFLHRDIFLVTSANYLQNTEQKLKLRSSYDLAIGNYFVNTNRAYFIGTIGAAFTNEEFTDLTLAGRNSIEGLASLELNLFDIGDLSLLTSVKLYPSFSQLGRYRVDYKFDLKYDLPLDLYIKFGTTMNYDSNPVEGAAKSDYVIQTTLGWEWN